MRQTQARRVTDVVMVPVRPIVEVDVAQPVTIGAPKAEHGKWSASPS